jgi:hypothetical protein
VVTGAAIFGGIYKVHKPTIYAPYAGLAVLVVGIVLAFAFPGRATAVTRFTELTPAEQGPVKL